MSEPKAPKAATPPSDSSKMALSEVVAFCLAVVWVIAIVAQLILSPEAVLTGPLSILMLLLVVFLPLALLWGVVSTARTIRALRDEAQRLQVAVDAMRHAYVVGQQGGATGQPSVEKSWMKSPPPNAKPKRRWRCLPRAAIPR